MRFRKYLRNGGTEMELQEIIEKRQSIRKYKEGDVPKEHLFEMIRAAGLAPSGKNVQNWHFVAIKNEALKQKIGQAVLDKNEVICLKMDKIDKERGDAFRKFVRSFTLFFLEAPVLIVVFSTDYRPSGYYELEFINCDPAILNDLVKHRNPGMQNLGAALENLTLKAVDLGYGSCILTSANYACAEIEDLLKREAVFDKEDYYMACMVALGIPEENQPSPKKKPLGQILTYIE